MEKENKVSPVSWIMEWAGTKKIYYVTYSYISGACQYQKKMS